MPPDRPGGAACRLAGDGTGVQPGEIKRCTGQIAMAEVGDIKPAEPLWPKRPPGKVGPGERHGETPPRERKRRDGDHDEQKRDDGHIDEYA